jgi:hypothetical protein
MLQYIFNHLIIDTWKDNTCLQRSDIKMEYINIVGYFMDRDAEEENEELNVNNVFVALFHELEGYSLYAPIGQHCQLAYEYLQECKEITRQQYIEFSKGFYTPSEYLK